MATNKTSNAKDKEVRVKAGKKTSAKKVALKTAVAKKAAAKKAQAKKATVRKTASKKASPRARAAEEITVLQDGIDFWEPEFRAEMHPKSSDRGAGGRDPFEIARRTVKGSVPAIVDAMVELAKQGSCSHAKTVLEMAGAKHMFDGESESGDRDEPWAKLVLERLDEAESHAAAEVKEQLPEAMAAQ